MLDQLWPNTLFDRQLIGACMSCWAVDVRPTYAKQLPITLDQQYCQNNSTVVPANDWESTGTPLSDHGLLTNGCKLLENKLYSF